MGPRQFFAKEQKGGEIYTMKKMLLYTIGILIVLLIASVIGLRKERAEKERFKANQTALLAQVDTLTTENGKHAADVLKLSLTVDELKQTNAALKKTTDDLGIKLKRVQSASTTGVKTEVKFITQVRDSIVYRDSIVVPVKAFTWRDAWTDVKGVIEKDSVDLSVSSVDTLTTIVHKVPHKFWFIKWGCKAIKQTVASSNPHTKITYTEYIEVK